MAWWLIIALAVALTAITYLLSPHPKKAQPDSTTDLQDPTTEAGKPIPVPFGTITVKGLNCLWYGDKSFQTKKVPA